MNAGTLARALGLRPGGMAAAVGGGGKTSLLEALAVECHGAGWRPALLTTTTKIFAPPPEAGRALLLGEAPLLGAAAEKTGAPPGFLTLARARLGEAPVPGAPGRVRMKLEGFRPEEVDALRPAGGVLLVEADGARGLPLKAPGPEEPALPAGTGIVLGVVGFDALDAPLDEAHVFRAEALARLSGQPPGSAVTAETLGRLAAHPEGLFRRAPERARRIVLLHKADLAEDLEILQKIAYIIWELAGAPRGPAEAVLCTSCSSDFPRVRHRLPA